MTEPIVAFSHVGMTFNAGQRNATVALQDINLTIAPGEFVALIGPSGCGKSTLLRLAGDLLQPSHGAITVNGKSARAARLEQAYGMVFQTPVLLAWRTVLNNVMLPMALRGLSRRDQQHRARELLTLMELDGFEQHYPWQLSGGMQQRVAIARALAIHPRLLLMDEPFAALDELTRERLNLELHRLWQQTQTTILFVTHSIAEAVFLATRVVVMSARPGEILHSTPVDLPLPRTLATREQPRFFALETEVREWLRRAKG